MGGALLATHHFLQTTENAKSYALDATVISANSAEEIKSAIEQKVADGKITIRPTSLLMLANKKPSLFKHCKKARLEQTLQNYK